MSGTFDYVLILLAVAVTVVVLKGAPVDLERAERIIASG